MKKLLVTLFLFCLIYPFMPAATTFIARQSLKEIGVNQLSLATVNFLEQRITLLGLSGAKNGVVFDIRKLSAAFDLPALWNKKLNIKSLEISGGSIDIHIPSTNNEASLRDANQEQTKLMGGLPAVKVSTTADTSSTLDKPKDLGAYQLSIINATINDIELTSNHPIIKSAKINKIELNNFVTGQDSKAGGAQAARLIIDTKVNSSTLVGHFVIGDMINGGSIKGDIKLTTDISELPSRYPVKGVLTAEVAVEFDGNTFTQKGLTVINDPSVFVRDRSIRAGKIIFTGESSYTINDAKPVINGQLVVNNLSVRGGQNIDVITVKSRVKEKLLSIDMLGITLPPKETFGKKPKGKDVTIERLRASSLNMDTLALKNIVIDNISGPNIKAGRVLIDAVKLKPTLSIGSVVAKNVHLLVASSSSTPLTKINQGHLNKPAASQENTKKDKPEAVSSGSAFPPLTVESIKVVSSILETVKIIKLEAMDVGKINTSDPSKDIKVKAKFAIDQLSSAELTGVVTLTGDADIKVNLVAELLEFKDLIKDKTGHELNSGLVKGSINIKAKNNMLIGQAKLDIYALDMVMDDAESLTVTSALYTLRDSDNNIHLDIPINGDISSPDFDFSNVINRSIEGVAKEGAKQAILYAIAPYGTLYNVAQKMYGLATAISLSVEFNKGQAVISEKGSLVVKKIVELMKDKKELNLRLCGPQIKGEKEDVAKLRVTMLKQDLISRGIEGTRLFACLPSGVDEGEPRVDVLI